MDGGTEEPEMPQENEKTARLTAADFIEGNFFMIRNRMAVAISHDLHSLSISVAKRAGRGTAIDFGTGLLETGFDQARSSTLIARSLEYLTNDIAWHLETQESSFSHWFGINAVLRLYEAKRWRTRDKLEVESLTDEIHASQVALIWRGRHEEAFDIYRLAGALDVWASSEVIGGSDFFRNIPKEHGRFRILEYLRDLLLEDKVPTQGAIRDHLKNADSGMISRWLVGMRVRSIIPPASNAGRRGGDRIFSIRPNDKKPGAVEGNAAKYNRNQYKKLNVGDGIFVGDPRSAMDDCRIQTIKDRLGSVYHFLILGFGMGELENREDLAEFERKLDEIGLALK